MISVVFVAPKRRLGMRPAKRRLLRLAGVEDGLGGLGGCLSAGGRDGRLLSWSGVELPTGTDPSTRGQGNRG